MSKVWGYDRKLIQPARIYIKSVSEVVKALILTKKKYLTLTLEEKT